MKKGLIIMIAILLALFTDNLAFASESVNAVFKLGQSYYKVNGDVRGMDVAPYTKNGRTYIPLRYAANAMNVSNIHWDDNAKKATLTVENKVIQYTIGSAEYMVNGESFSMDVEPEEIGGRVMLPIRYVAMPLGATTTWNTDDQSITVSYGSQVNEPLSNNANEQSSSSLINTFSTEDGFLSFNYPSSWFIEKNEIYTRPKGDSTNDIIRIPLYRKNDSNYHDDTYDFYSNASITISVNDNEAWIRESLENPEEEVSESTVLESSTVTINNNAFKRVLSESSYEGIDGKTLLIYCIKDNKIVTACGILNYDSQHSNGGIINEIEQIFNSIKINNGSYGMQNITDAKAAEMVANSHNGTYFIALDYDEDNYVVRAYESTGEGHYYGLMGEYFLNKRTGVITQDNNFTTDYRLWDEPWDLTVFTKEY